MMRLFWIFLLIITLCVGFPASANANIRIQKEGTDQILYQARHSVRDNEGDPWQVILFKRVKAGKTATIDLRLVGFPDAVRFRHPQSLMITTFDRILAAPDQFAQQAPAPNVGQYDLKEILPQLLTSKKIQLDLPLETAETRTLNLPYPILLEWQTINNN